MITRMQKTVQEILVSPEKKLLALGDGILEELLHTRGSRLHVAHDVLGEPGYPGAVSPRHRA